MKGVWMPKLLKQIGTAVLLSGWLLPLYMAISTYLFVLTAPEDLLMMQSFPHAEFAADCLGVAFTWLFISLSVLITLLLKHCSNNKK
jgi:hypothetical protein